MAEITLQVNGVNYGGWETVRVSLGMEQLCNEFTLSVSERFPGRPDAWRIATGDECRVLIGKTTVITGYVDDSEPSYDRASHSITVAGRDRAGDLVDCSAIHKTGQWRNTSFEKIVSDLCAPFAISVKMQATGLARFDTFAIQEGETAFEAIDRAARMRGLLVISDGSGGLIATRAGVERISTAIVKGVNVERAAGQYSMRDRHSIYIVKGQSPGTDDSTPEQNARTRATAEDAAVGRYRPLIIIGEQGTARDFRDRAAWEKNVRMGRGSRASYILSGWEHKDGLWLPGRLVMVKDDYLGIDGEMIVSRVDFVLDNGGSNSTIEVCDPRAFDIQPVPAPEAKAKKGVARWS